MPSSPDEAAQPPTGLWVFVRLQSRPGNDEAVAAAIKDVVAASRLEKGCLFIEGFRAKGGAASFYIHSRWTDEAAFDLHASLPHTVRFLTNVGALVDPAVEVSRTLPL